MTSNGKPLVPYMRQSRRKEQTISIEEQRRDIQAWAHSNGVALAPEIVEQGVSGSKPWRERALGEAIALCERGEAGGIIVAWQDRLSRENGRATAEVWEALENAGARLVCAAEGMDTASGDHELTFTLKAAIARDQWKRHGANWKGSRRSAVERGVFPGRTPIGYRKSRGKPFTIDRRQAPKVRQAFELRLAGEPYSAIGRRFGWSHSTARQILANPVYTGVIQHGPFVMENAHPAIVDKALFDAVQGARTVRPVPPGKTTEDRLLLGLARCASCGKALRVRHRKRADGSTVSSYFCVNAASVPCQAQGWVRAENLDAFVDAWFTQAIRQVPRMVDVVAAGLELQQAQEALVKAEAQLNRYAENVAIDDLAVFQRGIDARQKRVREARARVQQLAARLPRLPASGPLWAHWERFDVARRRSTLAAIVDRVVVRKGAGADLEGNVQIFWTGGDLAFPDVSDDEGAVRVVAA
jgi:DNA invertase Pin-like site-specific DNA recombinase